VDDGLSYGVSSMNLSEGFDRHKMRQIKFFTFYITTY